MSNDKITVLHGGATKNELKAAIRTMRDNLPDMIEHMNLMAQLHKAKFDALKEQGFSDEQALELCKQVL